MRALLTIVAALMALLQATPLLAADVTSGHQAQLLLRTLAYDRNLKGRSGAYVTIAVVFKADDEISELAQAEMVSTLRASTQSLLVSGLPVRVLAVPYDDALALSGTLELAHAGAVYLCPGLSRVAAISALARRHAILSMTGTASYLTAGIAVGFVSRDGRPVLIVNLSAVRAEGASLDAALLRFAELFKAPESK